MSEETRPIPPEMSQVRTLVAEVIAHLEAAGLASGDSYEVKTALMEALTNAVKCRPPDEASAGQMWFKLEGDHLWIRVPTEGRALIGRPVPTPRTPKGCSEKAAEGSI